MLFLLLSEFCICVLKIYGFALVNIANAPGFRKFGAAEE